MLKHQAMEGLGEATRHTSHTRLEQVNDKGSYLSMLLN